MIRKPANFSHFQPRMSSGQAITKATLIKCSRGVRWKIGQMPLLMPSAIKASRIKLAITEVQMQVILEIILMVFVVVIIHPGCVIRSLFSLFFQPYGTRPPG